MGHAESKRFESESTQDDCNDGYFTSSNPQLPLGPPPAYSETAYLRRHRGHNHATTGVRTSRQPESESTEEALELLRGFNTVFIVDDSGSMQGSLWNEATIALAGLAEKAGQYDSDGIDIYFLNSRKAGMNMKNAKQIRKLFHSVQPRGPTPIGMRLEELLAKYLLRIEAASKSRNSAALDRIRPVNYVIITDGAPTDEPEDVIVSAAQRLSAGNFPLIQVGIQFVQIGQSRRAAEYLRELDDGLANIHKIRDMVDTTPCSGYTELSQEILIKVLLGGINRRVDKKGAQSVM